MVIDQRPHEEVDLALGLLRRIADRQPSGPVPPVVPAIHVPENLPPDPGAADDIQGGDPR
ncbi:hypothetical protein Salmuc_05267 [Salipiger mucosus DSM 16094]|uniref:Uncharacterized protein n=1 Tax=Salipiger mucosus DSM 16094 TaxID=1123237 RepID=S9Q9Q8_9RHOB|nr:hypothetical protein Salmuc_05267 [Salipiger mucosus DSM 16094]